MLPIAQKKVTTMDKDKLIQRGDVLLSNLSGGDLFWEFDGSYTGAYGCLGYETAFNSPLCSYQLCYTLAFSNHKLINDLINKTHDNFDPAPLAQAKVLNNIKILDLGCGFQPTYARCSRKLGAQVYTVDVIPAKNFEFEEKYFSNEDRKTEAKHHILVDLNSNNALEKIIKKSVGEFDIVSTAHLKSGWSHKNKSYSPPHYIDELSFSLLKTGGFYISIESTTKIITKPSDHPNITSKYDLEEQYIINDRKRDERK